MLAAVYHGRENIAVTQVEQPSLADGEVLLAIEACTVCGVDLRTFRYGDAKITPPRILGHEFCGRVVEMAAKPPGLQVGDRVVMYIVLPCGTCHYCRLGMSNLCEDRTTMSYHHDGAFAQYMRVPAEAVTRHQLFKVPETIASHHAALCEPLGCVLNAHGRLQVGFKDTVCVIGGGPIGVMHAMISRLQGARKVMLLETSGRRLKIAERFGFDAYIQVRGRTHHDEVARQTQGLGPSVVIVACSVAQAQADALAIAGKGARVEFFGGLPKGHSIAAIDTNHLHYKELTLTGSYSEKRSDFEAAQALILGGRLSMEGLITDELPLERMTEAFALMETGESLKICVRMTT